MKVVYIILALALTSCGVQKMKQTYSGTDFSKSEQPYAQEWTGGAPGSGSGVTLYFPTKVVGNYEVAAIYFRNSVSKTISYTAEDRLMMVTRFRTDFNSRKDLIMDKDASKEMQNKAPSLEEFPFELKDNEAVIELKDKNSDKLTYIKITNIQERSQLALPSMPQ
ncbi:hypothetical protein [Nonlabens sp.]|uniref:hypothetical protein n=1 Tax=Nonlabens sp. TaxID=1888209 RepID=UPI003F698996